ncbi:MAG: hypothetical protein LBK82_13990 [Planctomycetaceae bacterium]|jgi:hypothetical protein|nr:hypothetical protein [Planctomycetaceae bacterium]
MPKQKHETEIDILDEKDLPTAKPETFKKIWNGMSSVRRNLNVGAFRQVFDREPTDTELSIGFQK